MPLITSADYEFIRKRIDASLNGTSLPDPLIESYQAEAEAWVGARVTDLDDIEGSEDADEAARYVHAQRASLYYLASLIAPTVNIPTSDGGIAGGSYTRKVVDPLANAARLKAMAEAELDAATAEVEVSVRSGRSGSAMTSVIW